MTRVDNIIASALIALAICCHYLDVGLGIQADQGISRDLLVAGTTMLARSFMPVNTLK